MHSSSHEQDPTIKVPVVPASTRPSTEKDSISKRSVQNTSPSSNEDYFKSYELDTYSCSEESQDYFLKMKLRKSQSLVDVIEKERHSSCHDIVEDDEFIKGYTSECDHENSLKSFQAINDAEICKESRVELYSNHNKNMDEAFDSFVGSVHHDSLFSIAILGKMDGEQHDNVDDLSVDHDCLGRLSSEAKPILERSHSLGNLRVKNTSPNAVLMSRSRSSENIFFINYERTGELEGDEFFVKKDAFNLLNTENRSVLDEKNSFFHDEYNEVLNEKGDGEYLMNKSECDNPSVNGNDSFLYANSEETCFAPDSNDRFSGMACEVRDAKYLYEETQCVDPSVGRDGCLYSSSDAEVNQIQSKTGGMGAEQYLHHTSSVSSWNELSPEEFHIRRIEDWITQITVQDNNIVEEQVESPKSVVNDDPHQGADFTTKKHETRSGHGMEVAYSYISTLNPTSPLAQMANLGLVTIPVLSAFVGLRVLNLSGNAIVRITSGALPRGLHMLKLSKNNISTIEGLRELTRLRVLDLCHNRITRIGHVCLPTLGLASCSSLKELYLAGNKISEVEGLHRLLKLSILDLRNNKISTAKGLRQLAANYSSLQAISLDGNPAQLNVGDTQLKKHLLTLLPHLVYYNKQSIRTSRSKEVSERSTWSSSSHKFESGLKSDHRLSRKGTHGTGLHRSASSSHVRSTNAASSFAKSSKSKHAHPSFIGTKQNDHISGIGKLLRLQPSNPLRRIQSEGKL